MAGPGDNTRAKSRGNGEADNFKRSVGVCMRAISVDEVLSRVRAALSAPRQVAADRFTAR